MAEYTIVISEKDREILHNEITDIQEWLRNFVSNRLRQISDKLISENTDRQPRKISEAEKRKLVDNIKIPKAKKFIE